jgi:hypothetical protein
MQVARRPEQARNRLETHAVDEDDPRRIGSE